MNRFRVSLAVLFLVAGCVWLAGPAVAGGPTSALLSVPGQGKTASLYYTDPEYDALASLVGMTNESGIAVRDRSGADHANGSGVTVTWMIHDVTPWRVDRIYVEGEGAPWIATQISGDSGEIWDSPIVWHQPTSPSELTALLNSLGVGTTATETGTLSGEVSSETTPAATPPLGTPDDRVQEASTFAGIWWGLIGVAAGALMTFFWMRSKGEDPQPALASGLLAE